MKDPKIGELYTSGGVKIGDVFAYFNPAESIVGLIAGILLTIEI